MASSPHGLTDVGNERVERALLRTRLSSSCGWKAGYRLPGSVLADQPGQVLRSASHFQKNQAEFGFLAR